jgi:uncharacterized protein YaiL (DUF2058 family)
MAKKALFGSRSQAIREFLAANPSAGVKTVVMALAAQGIVVKPGLVAAVKYKKPAKMSRRVAKASPAANGEVSVSVDALIAAKKLVQAVGGFERARSLVATLERLS